MEKTITYQSSSIFYRICGQGMPVILLHGFGEDGEIWNQQVEYLKDHFKLIVPDLPGSGRSEMIPDMTIEGMAGLVKEIADIEAPGFSLLPGPGRHGAEGVVLIGHSMGGYITLAFAEKYPQLLRAFMLVHSSAFADSEEKKAAREKSVRFIQQHGAYEFLKTSIPGLFNWSGHDWSGHSKWPDQSWPDELIEKGKAFLPETLIEYYRAMIARPDRTKVLKTFGRPIGFIIGEHDNAVPFQQSLQQCWLPQQSHIHILRNSAHMGMLEETGKVNEAILQFLQNL